MEEAYRLKPLLSATTSELHLGSVPNSSYFQLEAPDDDKHNVTGSDTSDRLIKIQIANHPLYPDLVSSYIECQKVGAPPELASLLEEMGRQSLPMNARRDIGHGPQLDEFMESYREVLHRFKEELSKPFNEATLFLGNMESQLHNLCKGTLTKSSDNNRSDEIVGVSEEELSCGEMEPAEGDESSCTLPCDQKLRKMLLRKYSGHFSNLRKEFLKRRKKGKLPKDARIVLMDWWNTHHRWPYPTYPPVTTNLRRGTWLATCFLLGFVGLCGSPILTEFLPHLRLELETLEWDPSPVTTRTNPCWYYGNFFW